MEARRRLAYGRFFSLTRGCASRVTDEQERANGWSRFSYEMAFVCGDLLLPTTVVKARAGFTGRRARPAKRMCSGGTSSVSGAPLCLCEDPTPKLVGTEISLPRAMKL